VHVDPSQYEQIPENPFRIQAGSLLFPTREAIVPGGGSSVKFVWEQGGDEDTFVFMFGSRPVLDLTGQRVDILEGVFLSASGPGFEPTWGFEQLLRELRLGGWTVIPTAEVLSSHWEREIERRMSIAP
jgi:hypothetical protein